MRNLGYRPNSDSRCLELVALKRPVELVPRPRRKSCSSGCSGVLLQV